VALALLLAACGGGGDPGAEPGGEERPTPSSPAATSEAPARDGWQVIRTWSRDEPPQFGVYTADHVAYWDEHQDGNPAQVTRAFDRSGAVVATHRSHAPAWYTQDVWLTAGHLVVEDINDAARRVELFVYDLAEGTRVPLPVQPSQPEVAAAEGRLAFISGTSREGMCRQVVDLTGSEPTTEEVGCAEPGAVLGDVEVAADGLAMSEVRAPETRSRCKELTVLTGGTATEVDLARDCLGWSVAVGESAYAWDEVDPRSPDLGTARGFVHHDGEVVELGPVSTDSIVACGDGFYWEVQAGRGPRIDGWRPGEGVTTIRPASMREGPTTLTCTEGRWLQTRFDEVHGGEEELTFEVYDTAAGR